MGSFLIQTTRDTNGLGALEAEKSRLAEGFDVTAVRMEEILTRSLAFSLTKRFNQQENTWRKTILDKEIKSSIRAVSNFTLGMGSQREYISCSWSSWLQM